MPEMPPMPEVFVETDAKVNGEWQHVSLFTDDQLLAYAIQYGEAVREACAKVCEEVALRDVMKVGVLYAHGADAAAAAIRSKYAEPGDCIHCGKEICNDLGWCNSFKAAPAIPRPRLTQQEEGEA